MFKKLFGSIMGNEETNEQQNVQSEAANETHFESSYRETEYDPETFHGTHYDVEDFDNEGEVRKNGLPMNVRAEKKWMNRT